ncbi:hypothetical protein FRX31_033521, partial [Thalictrum thalictroides]
MVLWEIWKERSARRFEDDYRPNTSQDIIIKIRFWILRLGEVIYISHRSSDNFCQVAKALGLRFKNPPLDRPLLVYWTRPPKGFLALNTDGASSDNIASGGGVVRDGNGNM